MLRMLFICCDDAIPLESRVVLALKTLCGFSAGEIALRLFTSEANVYKRLARARDRLREAPPDVQTPPLETLRSRLPSVRAVLYLLFNEGYLSAHAEQAIRRELCDEAIRLATLLAEHSVGAVPETFALLALMHLHAARLGARLDGMGGLLLLEEQDRSLWDRERRRFSFRCRSGTIVGNARLGSTSMRTKTNPDAVALFWNLAAELMSEHPSVVEGTIMNGRCLRVGEEFLALVDYRGSGLVVKLSTKRVDELIASGVGKPFAPAGSPFKEWVSVPKPDRRRWRLLLQEGVVSRLADEHGD